MGEGGMALHSWVLSTDTFQKTHGSGSGTTGLDNEFASRGFANIGAWIIGRNMFGPIRGPWPDNEWKGWWGANPPYHCPVYVLTHHPRESLEMEGGTVFHFTSDPIEIVLKKAFESANGKDVRLGGGVDTVRQFLRRGLIDELHIAVSHVLLGSGENLFEGLNLADLGYAVEQSSASESATHLIIKQK